MRFFKNNFENVILKFDLLISLKITLCEFEIRLLIRFGAWSK